MELQGLGLLSDIKLSLKKKLFRHIINYVERKLQKDYSSINSDHFIQIILNETKAVHGLLDEFIIGKFEKKFETIDKLLKIMNRNLEICLLTFKRNMGLFMLHLDGMKMRNIAFQRPLSSIKKYLKDYLAVVLNSCYYIHILRMYSGSNSLQFQQFISECKLILSNFMIKFQYSYEHSTIKIQTLLLVMAINIKNKNFQHAKNQFYETIAQILYCFKKLQRKKYKNELNKAKRKCELFNLIIISLINNQRLLIQCDISIGWEIGFSILRSIEKQIRFDQTGWRKYIRRQYEYNQIIQSNKLDEIREHFLPFITQQSSILKMLLQSFHQTKNYANNSILLQNFQCTKKSKYNKKKTCYSTKMEFTQAFEDINDASNYGLTIQKTKRNFDENSKIDNKKMNIFLYGNNKVTKSSQGYSVDWSQTTRPCSQLIKNAFKNINDKQKLKRRTQRIQQNSSNSTFKSVNKKVIQRKSKRLKRIAINGNSNYSYNDTELTELQDQDLKNCADMIKLRKKNKILHYYISQQNYSKNKRQLNISPDLTKSEIKFGDDHKNDNKSLQINLLDNLIQLLLRNKKKLRIEKLTQKYELAKKRKKIRDYQVQMIQYELNKSISKLFNKNSILKQTSTSINLNKNLNEGILQSLLNHVKMSNQKQQQNIIDQNKLVSAHNKSKEVITEMLKKITRPHIYQPRKSRSSLHKNSLSSLKFSII